MDPTSGAHPEFEVCAMIDNGGVLHTDGTSGTMHQRTERGEHRIVDAPWPSFPMDHKMANEYNTNDVE